MKRLIHRLANNIDIPPEQAADELDRVLHELLQRLRSGKAAHLPGLGVLLPDAGITFERETRDEHRTPQLAKSDRARR